MAKAPPDAEERVLLGVMSHVTGDDLVTHYPDDLATMRELGIGPGQLANNVRSKLNEIRAPKGLSHIANFALNTDLTWGKLRRLLKSEAADA